MQPMKILLVDDEDYFREVMCEHFSDAGYQILSAKSYKEAARLIRKDKFDVGVFDIRITEGNGMKLLELSKTIQPAAEIIMLTGYGTVENAVKAMKMGSYDYLTKPCRLSKLEIIVKRAYEHKRITFQNVGLKAELSRLNQYDEIIGTTPAILRVKEFIDKVAPVDSSVLIQGESGTGKELVARMIWEKSPRSSGPFIVIDCGALDGNLLNSELFGHVKGAYTGAEEKKLGLVEIADGGTLFVDEVADMSPSLQSRLLRILETGEFRRLGGTEQLRVDTRIIAATNRDIYLEIERGNFRKDLFYRLNVVAVTLPTLKQRKEDIPLLVESFIKKQSFRTRNLDLSHIELEKGLMERLMDYDWPGNVRELRNVIERAFILSAGGKLLKKSLPWQSFPKRKDGSEPTLQEIEKAHVQRVYLSAGRNKTRTANILNISLRNLYRKLQLYQLDE